MRSEKNPLIFSFNIQELRSFAIQEEKIAFNRNCEKKNLPTKNRNVIKTKGPLKD
jgi:hypothetical protein